MSKQQNNLTIALEALNKEVGVEVGKEALAEYVAELDAIVAAVRAIKAPHAKAIRVAASTASRVKRAERVAKALALLEAQEAAGARE